MNSIRRINRDVGGVNENTPARFRSWKDRFRLMFVLLIVCTTFELRAVSFIKYQHLAPALLIINHKRYVDIALLH